MHLENEELAAKVFDMVIYSEEGSGVKLIKDRTVELDHKRYNLRKAAHRVKILTLLNLP